MARGIPRWYHKGWQSDRPLKRDSRRVKWYKGQNDVRLMFEDGEGRTNRFFLDEENATIAYEGFINDEFRALDAPEEFQVKEARSAR